MAATTVDHHCYVCGLVVEPDTRAVLICAVRTTREPRTQLGLLVPVPEGRVRVRHLSGGKPRAVAHALCFGRKML